MFALATECALWCMNLSPNDGLVGISFRAQSECLCEYEAGSAPVDAIDETVMFIDDAGDGIGLPVNSPDLVGEEGIGISCYPRLVRSCNASFRLHQAFFNFKFSYINHVHTF